MRRIVAAIICCAFVVAPAAVSMAQQNLPSDDDIQWRVYLERHPYTRDLLSIVAAGDRDFPERAMREIERRFKAEESDVMNGFVGVLNQGISGILANLPKNFQERLRENFAEYAPSATKITGLGRLLKTAKALGWRDVQELTANRILVLMGDDPSASGFSYHLAFVARHGATINQRETATDRILAGAYRPMWMSHLLVNGPASRKGQIAERILEKEYGSNRSSDVSSEAAFLLVEVLQYAPEPYKERAWDIFWSFDLRTESLGRLTRILDRFPSPYKERLKIYIDARKGSIARDSFIK